MQILLHPGPQAVNDRLQIRNHHIHRGDHIHSGVTAVHDIRHLLPDLPDRAVVQRDHRIIIGSPDAVDQHLVILQRFAFAHAPVVISQRNDNQIAYIVIGIQGKLIHLFRIHRQRAIAKQAGGVGSHIPLLVFRHNAKSVDDTPDFLQHRFRLLLRIAQRFVTGKITDVDGNIFRIPGVQAVLLAEIQTGGAKHHHQHHGAQNADGSQSRAVALHPVGHGGHRNKMVFPVIVVPILLQQPAKHHRS